MKFKDYKYVRPNIDEVVLKLENETNVIKSNKKLEDLCKAIDSYNETRVYFISMWKLCSIRNSINTLDEFYSEEMNYFDNNSPLFTNACNKFEKALLNSSLRNELENKYGKHWFDTISVSSKCFDECIIEDSILENKLVTKYDKLIASAKIDYDGKINNISSMNSYLSNPNREIRRESAIKTQEFFKEHEQEFDSLYDELVKVRTQMAKKMGYSNYVLFGYARLGRTDYNPEMVKSYRDQIKEFLVPIVDDIFKEQAKRIGIKDFKFYDQAFEFIDGNPTPKGNASELLEKAHTMYSEMCPETKEYFDYMLDHELLDLETKPNKAIGGYCDYLDLFKSPFIFANFNGTKGDVEVLTHEAGHAFQVYESSKTIKNPDLIWPTYEACEIHSMSMEYFAYPWLHLFFEEDTKKYMYSHMNGTVKFIPYGVLVDEFQHYVYENYNSSCAARKEEWLRLEKKYLPSRDYGELEVFSRGGFWYRQSHIFQSPFYYIDYTLAQVCAIEFYLLSLKDRQKAFDKYVSLCKLGGSLSFLNLLKEVGLSNPFEKGTINNIVNELIPVINKIKL